MRQKVDVDEKIEDQFKEHYKVNLESKVDQMMENGNNKIQETIIKRMPYHSKKKDNDNN